MNPQAQAIIARCTRDGVTSWQNVARQMGRSLDSVRGLYDPAYLTVRPWPHPCEEVEAEPEPINEDDTSSPHVKGPGLHTEILRHLQSGPTSVENMAHRLSRSVGTIRSRLTGLHEQLLVCHDDRYPRSWSLTAKGLRIAVTGCEVQVTSWRVKQRARA